MENSFRIASLTANTCEVESFINSILKKFSIDKCLHFKILLSINEAVNNAIQHGNKYDPSKSVIILFDDQTEYYLFSVIDEGNGFVIDKLKDPTSSENIKNESGRGVFIMFKYSDKVEFINNENCTVNLYFKK